MKLESAVKIIVSILARTSTKTGLLLLLALNILLFGLIASTIRKLMDVSGGIGILDFDRGYTRERVLEVFGSYGEAGMALYSRIQMLDLINPAVYSLLFSSLIFLLVRGSKLAWLAVIPLIAGSLDYLENLTLYLLAKSFPDIPTKLVSISSSLSIIKNAVLFGAVLAFIIGIIMWLKNRFTDSPQLK